MTTACHRLGVLLAVVIALPACRSIGFYAQAVRGQWEVMACAKPLAQVRADPETPPKLRSQLALVEFLREFARDELRLPSHRQFRTYGDLGRRYVVWNVYAAPEFSLEAKTWSYPLLGELKYRGYFRKQMAEDEAARLRREGYDVMIGGVRVYSTLGWFSDPVLNTFIQDEEADLAETLFHELTHARFFVSGDTDFNEAYATAAAQLGVRQWFQKKGDTKALARFERAQRQDRMVLDLLEDTRLRLGAIYAKDATTSPEETRLAKARILRRTLERYAAMKQRSGWVGNHDGWVNKDLNNARLASLATYHELVPHFIRLFHAQGGDWERFHRAVEAMSRLRPEQRRARLQSLP